MDENEGIRPEGSARNTSGPTNLSSSMARQLQIERSAAAHKSKVIEEEAALLEMEGNWRWKQYNANQ